MNQTTGANGVIERKRKPVSLAEKIQFALEMLWILICFLPICLFVFFRKFFPPKEKNLKDKIVLVSIDYFCSRNPNLKKKNFFYKDNRNRKRDREKFGTGILFSRKQSHLRRRKRKGQRRNGQRNIKQDRKDPGCKSIRLRRG